jgi:AraC-like DNA-binding protein
MRMKEEWSKAIITDVNIALYVPPGAGHKVHTNRPFHGFVINDTLASDKNYHFSDGQILKTRCSEIFYLPKGSSYQVETTGHQSGCWAINFSLHTEISDTPFSLLPKNPAVFIDLFKEATAAFQSAKEDRDLILRKILYDIILKLRKEFARSYVSSTKRSLIQPALDQINHHFADNEMSVHSLAVCCGISDAYLRRLFADCLGVAPQDYITNRRIDYAKQLLQSGQFSVSEIAEMCGYSEPCHFSRVFTKLVGVSPRSFSKSGRKAHPLSPAK